MGEMMSCAGRRDLEDKARAVVWNVDSELWFLLLLQPLNQHSVLCIMGSRP
jgi:hypothetical protein